MVNTSLLLIYIILCATTGSRTVQSFSTENRRSNIRISNCEARQQRPTIHLAPSQRVGSSAAIGVSVVGVVLYTTGGWGIGPQRELTPEEFATGGQLQNKKYFEGYQIRNRGEFMRQVAQDKQEMIRGELDELLGVAAAAGLKVKNPQERLNKFDPSLLNDNDEEEGLDVSVQWDDENENDRNVQVINDTSKSINNAGVIDAVTDVTVADSESITRLDEDTGSLGVW